MTKQTLQRQTPSTPAPSHAPSAFAPRGFGDSLSRLPAPAPQAKLTVNQPGDRYEQEADSVADSVMRMGDSEPVQREGAEEDEEEKLQMKPLAGAISPLVQRAEKDDEEEEGPVQAKALPGASGLVQRAGEDDEEEEKVQAQRKETGDGQTADVSGVVSQGLSGGGQPLDDSTRAFMEPRFGHDFSQVRIHTDSRASESSEQIAARAYTVGSDIAFRSGEFSPGSSDGQRLLAHELTHVVQQVGGVPTNGVRRKVDTNGGSFDTSTYAAATGGSLIGADIDLKFTPNDQVVADNIGLSQTVKTFHSTTKDGPVDTSGNARQTYPDALGKGEGDVGRGVDQLDAVGRPPSGSTMPQTNPIYSVGNTATKASATLTDIAPKPTNGWGDNGAHKLKTDGTLDIPKPAQLIDGPRRQITFAGQQYTQTFEVAALVLDGPQANTYLGTVAWGWKCGADGIPTLDPTPLQLVSPGVPSVGFMEAAAKWNDLTFKDPTTGIVYNSVNLPVATVSPGTLSTSDLMAQIAKLNAEMAAKPKDLNNKELDKRACEDEMKRRNAKVDVTVVQREGIFTDDKVYIKLIGSGGVSQTTPVKMGNGASHSFLVPLASVLPLGGTLQVQAWDHDLLDPDDLILTKDWMLPYGACAISGGNGANYNMAIQFER